MNEKIYILCEEYEDDDGIREFSIIATSFNENKCKEKMQEEIKCDKYGLIKENGVEDYESNTHFCTNFNNGFVEYYILEENVI